jgi:hypothetical protein
MGAGPLVRITKEAGFKVSTRRSGKAAHGITFELREKIGEIE